ncbi:imidazole glycerol phosphate synthase subunit HisF [Micrococcoides hystricis]|uniref:Imidazole glycerol phosphate synthase subunit HisF n=1 Tax=Micrococcoides hystricis TaxID=1572761 RepID=A0ABV6P702_9MICC
MSVAIRVIPCLDVDGGRVVKGVKFENLRDAGDPVELAQRYNAAGADELTFLDVTASTADRATTFDVIQHTAEHVFIPLTVGGGVRTVENVEKLLHSGADKVSISTAAVARPEVINEISEKYGNQVLVLSLDARKNPELPSGYEVTTHGGKTGTGIDAIAWCEEAEERGVGEILLNSIDADGTKDGFDLELIRKARAAVSVPLIASGGAGKPEHFPPAVEAGANAVLAASLFHFGPEDMVSQVKQAISEAGYPVR